MIERVTEVETVEVGKRYLVPCIRVDRPERPDVGPALGWLPVIGPAHEDAAILHFPIVHYHYDWRFVSTPQARRLYVFYKGRLQEFWAHSKVETASGVIEKEWRAVRCRRVMSDFPAIARGSSFDQAGLEDAFASQRLKPDCRVCPHRGLPLNGLPVREGAVVCPGHGLRWNLTTGELVRRVT